MNSDKISHETMGTLYKEEKDQMRINILDAMFKADDLLDAVIRNKQHMSSSWWVLMGNLENNQLVSLGKVSNAGPPGAKPQTCKLQIQAPPNAGSWKFYAFVKNDSNMGCDLTIEMTLTVIDAPELSAEIIEDDTSEPGDDTIAGQMAAIKSEKIPGESGDARAVRDDVDDSSDSDDSPKKR
ncbi:secretory subunit [Chytriomyces hyalinus]|nr:secretory subunit [Chytriomyces hyalinus]